MSLTIHTVSNLIIASVCCTINHPQTKMLGYGKGRKNNRRFTNNYPDQNNELLLEGLDNCMNSNCTKSKDYEHSLLAVTEKIKEGSSLYHI